MRVRVRVRVRTCAFRAGVLARTLTARTGEGGRRNERSWLNDWVTLGWRPFRCVSCYTEPVKRLYIKVTALGACHPLHSPSPSLPLPPSLPLSLYRTSPLPPIHTSSISQLLQFFYGRGFLEFAIRFLRINRWVMRGRMRRWSARRWLTNDVCWLLDAVC